MISTGDRGAWRDQAIWFSYGDDPQKMWRVSLTDHQPTEFWPACFSLEMERIDVGTGFGSPFPQHETVPAVESQFECCGSG